MIDFDHSVATVAEIMKEFYASTQPTNSIPQIAKEIGKHGFWMSAKLCAIGAPVVFILVLSAVWSLARVGKVRKTLSTVLICCLFPVLYTMIIVAVLLFSWTATAVVVTYGTTMLLPIFVLTALHWFGFSVAGEFIKKQINTIIDDDEVGDISLSDLIVAVVVFLFSLPSTCIIVCVLTLLKSPFVIISVVCSLSYSTLRSICGMILSSVWAIWFLPLFAIGFAIGVPLVIVSVILSIAIKILLAALWPSYVASGWIRSLRSRRRQPAIRHPIKTIKQAMRAAYQVIWFSDALTNVVILESVTCFNDRFGRKYRKFKDEIQEVACGDRIEFSHSVKKLTFFPPPKVVGVLTDENEWRLNVEEVARDLNIPLNVFEKIWKSFFSNSIIIGKENIEKNLLTKDYLMEIPPAATIGLSQLVILACVEKTLKWEQEQQHSSTKNKRFRNVFVVNSLSETMKKVPVLNEQSPLSNSSSDIFLLTEKNRPKGQIFFENVWNKMLQIKRLSQKYHELIDKDEEIGDKNTSLKEKALFEAIILSAGESFEFLPPKFQSFFLDNGITERMDFDVEFFNKTEQHKNLQKIRNLLNDISLQVIKHEKFKKLMMKETIIPLTET